MWDDGERRRRPRDLVREWRSVVSKRLIGGVRRRTAYRWRPETDGFSIARPETGGLVADVRKRTDVHVLCPETGGLVAGIRKRTDVHVIHPETSALFAGVRKRTVFSVANSQRPRTLVVRCIADKEPEAEATRTPVIRCNIREVSGVKSLEEHPRGRIRTGLGIGSLAVSAFIPVDRPPTLGFT